jgi:hypothetical protein
LFLFCSNIFYKTVPCLEPITPIATIEPSPPSPPDPPRSTVSLPFTYTDTGEENKSFSCHPQMSTEPILEKVIKINNDTMQTTLQSNHIETILKREYPKIIRSLVSSKATVNRSIEFRLFQRIPIQQMTMSLTNDIPIRILVIH